MKTNTTTNTTTTAPTATTTLTDVVVAGAPALIKSFIGVAAAAVATAATAKLLKTGQSQKAYEEVLKEFTAK